MATGSLLIANDEPGALDILAEIAGRADPDLRLLLAQTTQQAMRLVEDAEDLLGGLIDYTMPADNGPSVIRHIRKLEERRELCRRARLILTTAADEFSFVHKSREALEAGADDALNMGLADTLRRLRAVLTLLRTPL